MSSCLIMQEKNRIIMGADTALSSKIDGKPYRIGNNQKKIFSIKDSLIFCSGNINVVKDVIKYINNMDIIDIENISNFLKNKNIKRNKGIFNIEIVIAKRELDKIGLYQLSEYNNFDVVEHTVDEGNIQVFSAGIKTNESLEIATNLLKKRTGALSVFKDTYNALSCEEVGGRLIVWEISNDIKKIYEDEIEEKNINYINAHSIVADYLVGRMIVGESLLLENEDSTFSVSGSMVTITNGAINIASLTDAGALAGKDSVDFATGEVTNSGDLPNMAATPGGAGLYLGSGHLGYYNGSSWKTYMDNLGRFYLGGTSGKLQWDGTNLAIEGSITITGGAGYTNLTDVPAELHQYFYQATAPTSGMETGDYWVESGTNELYRYNGTFWISIQDADISQAISDAQDAIMQLTYIGMDSIISPAEKQSAREKWYDIQKEGNPTNGTLRAQAVSFGISTTTFDSKYSALNTYLNTTLGVFNDMTTPTNVVRSTWDTTWGDYFIAKANLINAISSYTSTHADWDDLSNIPGTLQAPSGSGLYLSSTHLGYYDGGAWKTYMDNTGKFYFKGSGTGSIRWNVQGLNQLQGFDGTNVQWYADADDGKLYAGGGTVILAADGMTINHTTSSTVGMIWKYNQSSTRGRFLHDYGNYNVFLGWNCGNFSLSGAEYNVGIGYQSLDALTSGDNNVGIGINALGANNSGYDNVGIGKDALVANQGGYHNTAIGTRAMESNISGYYNAALGHRALLSITSGLGCTGIGVSALSGTTGNYNTAVGLDAGYNITTGDSNVFVGKRAGYGRDTSEQINSAWNVGIGANVYTTGAYSIVIGANSWSGANYTNIGTYDVSHNILTDTAHINARDYVYLGDGTAPVRAKSYEVWTSDVRTKKDIEALDTGLDIILKLKPKKFKMNYDDEKQRIGFIAQDIATVAPEAVSEVVNEYNRVPTLKEGEKYLTYTIDFAIPYLVKAVQEQQDIIEKLEKRIFELEGIPG